MTVRLISGDCREVLRTLPDKSVHCCVTSPPYFGLRDYGTAQWAQGDDSCDHVAGSKRYGSKSETAAGQIRGGPFRDTCGKCGATRIDRQMGLEPTPDEFVAGMVDVFREVRRVLRDDGTLWLNIGDSYNSHGPGGFREGEFLNPGGRQSEVSRGVRNRAGTHVEGLKRKDLIGIPWLLAFALRADGWYLRQDIIWSKPNPMPESVRDRCTKAHEYLFLLSKSPKYHFDAEAIRGGLDQEPDRRLRSSTFKKVQKIGHALSSAEYVETIGSNKRSVWEVTTQSFSEAHFATFPPALIEPCILAGCPALCCSACGAPYQPLYERGTEQPAVDPSDLDRFGDGSAGVHRKIGGQYQKWLDANPKQYKGALPSCACDAPSMSGTVLDPFGGAGTTGLVADRLQRSSILIELNPEYAAIAERRLHADAGMFAEIAA